MTYDVLYSVKGDPFIGRHFKTVGTERKAYNAAKEFLRHKQGEKLGVHHFCITCEDGRTLFDSRTDDLSWWV